MLYDHIMRRKYFIQPGEKYGRYTAVSLVKHTTRKGKLENRWKCVDELGMARMIRHQVLAKFIPLTEVEKLQRIEHAKLVENNVHQLGIRNRYYGEYKRNAIKRKIEFGLSFEQFNKLITQDCHYCGQEPVSSDRWDKMEHKGQPKLCYNGIDRIDSNAGYTETNAVACCSKCNLMKNIFDTSEFLDHVYKICQFNKKSSTTIPNGSTSQANGDGNGVSPNQENDIV